MGVGGWVGGWVTDIFVICTKAGNLIAEDGVPTFYISCIVKMAETVEVTAADKEKVKKMSKTNAKSLNAMKQNIKKNNANYEKEIAKFMENPVEEEAEASESEDESDSDRYSCQNRPL